MVGDGEKEFQVEGTVTAKALRQEHTLLFRGYLESHSSSYQFIASELKTYPSVPAL